MVPNPITGVLPNHDTDFLIPYSDQRNPSRPEWREAEVTRHGFI